MCSFSFQAHSFIPYFIPCAPLSKQDMAFAFLADEYDALSDGGAQDVVDVDVARGGEPGAAPEPPQLVSRRVRGKLGRASFARQNAEKRAAVLQQGVRPNLTASCVQAVLGNTDNPQPRNNQVFTESGVIDLPGSNSKDFKKDLDRGVVSHIAAQADGLSSRFFQSFDGASLDGIIGEVIMDGASMWVAKPYVSLSCVGPNKETLEEKFELRRRRRGRNIHMPVLNKVEHVHCVEAIPPRRDAGEIQPMPKLRSASIVAPAQVLPQANTGTVRRHLNEWTVISPSGPGDKVDPDGKIRNTLSAVTPWK